ncbi:YqgE/AlgH family protein [Phycisphaeraceae bacterium D3-23]
MDSLSGNLLVAAPAMDDPNFARAVILLVDHGDHGALGLVLNRPSQTKVDAVWDQISILPCPVDQWVRRGGPCPGPLMLLHDRPTHAQVEVCRGVCFSSEEALVTGAIEPGGADEDDDTPDTRLGFYVGYAGWEAGQLEAELTTGSWLVTQATPAVVFDEDADDGLWMRVITGIDRAIAMLAMNPKLIPHDPAMN